MIIQLLVPEKDEEVNSIRFGHFVSRGGQEGREWLMSLQCSPPIEQRISEALSLLRRNHINEGASAIRELEKAILLMSPGLEDSACLLLDKFLSTLLAYQAYKLGNFATADKWLMRAGEALKRAIELRQFLLPLALDFGELETQRLRIRFAANDWHLARSQLDLMEQQATNAIPILVCSSHEIRYRDLLDRYLLLQPFSESEWAFISGWATVHRRLTGLGKLVAVLLLKYSPLISAGLGTDRRP